jgi:hypothetical protein
MKPTGNPPKLLFLVTEDWYFVSHRLPLAVAAREQGFDVAVATRVRDAGDTIRNAGLRLIPVDFERASLSPLSETKTIGQLISIYRREKPDIVHHVALKPVLYGAIAARVAGTPAVVNAIMGLGFVFSSNSTKARLLRPMVQQLLKSALSRSGSRTIVQNADDLAFLGRNRIATPGTVRLIPGSGVDVELYTRRRRRRAFRPSFFQRASSAPKAWWSLWKRRDGFSQKDVARGSFYVARPIRRTRLRFRTPRSTVSLRAALSRIGDGAPTCRRCSHRQTSFAFRPTTARACRNP